ncbi:MAG TPA: restriction endonuclease, partial [Gammaproteobacteria bacterium]|nr:restriction endonuclease [Gammaproteobacteria bacterium]
MQGKLFTQDFLERGISETAAWRGCPAEAVARCGRTLERLLRGVPATADWNEATTETELIEPVLTALGWNDFLKQQTTSRRGRADVPDYLLFPNGEAKRKALEGPEDRRYRHGASILEAKRWERPLDRAERGDTFDPVTPSNQILRYLSRADVASERRIKWGILTNGRYWRLYYQDARARAEDFVEFDLMALAKTAGAQGDLLNPGYTRPEHFLKVFYLIFRREAFLSQPGDGAARSFHLLALDESRHWEMRVSEDLGHRVFEQIFPRLARALAASDPARPATPDAAWLSQLNEETLTLLYRLLFLLYAEDRNLLPVHDPRYDDYSLRAIREDIARRIDDHDVFSASAARYYSHLRDLFHAIDAGDDSVGIPPYNGGLFEGRNHPLLARARIADAELAPLLDLLSRAGDAGERKWINYRDLSVQQLGSIYERLLERALVVDENGEIAVRLSIYGRKGTGTYYTHDDLVKLIVREAVGPLVHERLQRFGATASERAVSRRSRAERLHALREVDAASKLLELRVCDPAIGSGHFLVALVDYLADEVLEAMAGATAEIAWAPESEPYESPLAGRIAEIRGRLLESAKQHNWTLDPAQLDDRHIVRRMILKRVVHGVDKNPMAVELAKLSLWLHTFTVGAPLSFLDHHLQAGDALFGERLERVLDELRARGAIFAQNTLTRIGSAADSMARIADLTDVDIAEVKQSEALFGGVVRDMEPLKLLLDFWQALRWRWPNGWPRDDDPEARALRELVGGNFGDLIEVVAAGHVTAATSAGMPVAEAAQKLLDDLLGLARRERFFHWELAFPGVWKDLVEGRPHGGFDAVIGNPPWDRMKLQEVEWFADRRPAIALEGRAADRKRAIAELEAAQDPLWSQYLDARDRAETAARVARACGDYPLLASGDINLYSLFVERARSLVKPEG